MIPLTRPLIGDREEAAVLEVLRSGMLVQGPRVAAFEEAVAQAAGREHAVAVSSGTAALALALEVVGVGRGDEVLCPALSWPSPAHAAARLGARVKLVDVDPYTWNSSARALADARGPSTRAVIAIDQFGNPVDLGGIDGLAGIPLIEDAACALGSRFADGTPCGGLGAIACFSFHPRKLLTTGEGGVCVTDDDAMAERLRVLRNHGQRTPGVFVEPAGNSRLGEMAGALGEAQMVRLEDALARRLAHALAIVDALRGTLQFQAAVAGAKPTYQTLGALLPRGIPPDKVVATCRKRGVQVGRLSYALDSIGTLEGDAPVARDIAARGVALPLFPQMTDDERATVIEVVRAAVEQSAP